MSMQESSRILIENCRGIATMNASNTELEHADIYIKDNVIVEVGKGLREKHQLSPETPVIDGRGHVALPGFVNVHHHFFQVLTRGIPRIQNVGLFEWLGEQYPLFEAMGPEFFYTSAKVAMSELLLTGCTTTSDHHYLFPKNQPVELIDEDIRAARELGMRFHPTRGSMTLGEDDGGLPPMTVIEDDDRVLADYERLISTYHDPEPYSMLRVALAPCAPFNVTPYLFRETVSVARKHQVRLHTHLAETDDEDVYVADRFKKRPFEYVADQGWDGSDIWFVHCVKLNSAEIEHFAKTGIGVSHCPSSNCRLGSGIAPIPEMLRAGVSVGLGVDGSASNDSGNMLAEARLAFLLHRAQWGVEALTARDCLSMLTRGGAACLGRDDIGHLSPGAAADIVLYDMEQVGFAGGASIDPIAALILCGTNQHVSWSIINGKIVVERGKICGLSEKQLVLQANELTAKLIEHGMQKRGIDYRKAPPIG